MQGKSVVVNANLREAVIGELLLESFYKGCPDVVDLVISKTRQLA